MTQYGTYCQARRDAASAQVQWVAQRGGSAEIVDSRDFGSLADGPGRCEQVGYLVVISTGRYATGPDAYAGCAAVGSGTPHCLANYLSNETSDEGLMYPSG